MKKETRAVKGLRLSPRQLLNSLSTFINKAKIVNSTLQNVEIWQIHFQNVMYAENFLIPRGS